MSFETRPCRVAPQDERISALSRRVKQIQDKDYFAKFKIEGDKPITLVGMNFDMTNKGIVINWMVKKMQ